MKQNCCRCQKLFDYEQHNGICPHCAAYNRPLGSMQDNYNIDGAFTSTYNAAQKAHEDLHRQYDSAPAHQPQRQHEQYHRQYDGGYKHPTQGTPPVQPQQNRPAAQTVQSQQNGQTAQTLQPQQNGQAAQTGGNVQKPMFDQGQSWQGQMPNRMPMYGGSASRKTGRIFVAIIMVYVILFLVRMFVLLSQ